MSEYKWLKISLSAVIILGMIVIVFIFPKLTSQSQFFVFTTIASMLAGALLLTITPITKQILSLLGHLNQNGELSGKRKPSILIVDDSAANRRILNEMLNTLSLSAVEASSGKQALSVYQKYEIQLIFMDIEMQDLNGMDTSKIIRAQESTDQRTPIIATSAHNSRDKILLALASGFDDYLTKPIDVEQLKITTDRWLKSANANEAGEKQYKKELIPTSLPTTETDLEPADLDINHNVEKISKETTKKVVDIKKSLIYSHNNRDLAKDMLAMLITMVSKEKNNMITFFQQETWDELGELAHKLNGGSCYCGVPELQEYAKILDESIENRELDTAKKTFPKLLQAMDDLLAWQEEYDLDVIFDI